MMSQWKSWIYTCFPSSLELVVHLNTDVDTYDVLYKKSVCGWWNIPQDIPKSGYFMFKVWNAQCLTFEYIVLSHDHVERCLEYPNFFSICAKKLVKELSDYVVHNICDKPHAIMEVLIDGEDKYMYPFLRSMYIVENATPHMINLLYSWLLGEKCVYRDVQLTDYHFTPYELAYNEYIFRSNKSV